MEQGVTVIDPSTTYIDKQIKIGRDTVIRPFTILQGRCEIGERCEIGPHVQLTDSNLGDDSTLKFCCVDHASLGNGVRVGPYASIRPGTRVADGARVGTFVEITRSEIGDNADVLHLCYIGDAQVGKRTSIGTGTVTVNFDGKRRNPTRIGDDVYLGSRTSLVAPVEVPAGSRFQHNELLSGRVAASNGSAPHNGNGHSAQPTAEPKTQKRKRTPTKKAAKK
jgi:bifunctional UDP-N-acetylglucosamine pyrophosphorylase/glucosamine-1-phosphate N-acetyltransferase